MLCFASILIRKGEHIVFQVILFRLLVLYEHGVLYGYLSMALMTGHRVRHEAHGEGLPLGREQSHLMNSFVYCHSAKIRRIYYGKKDSLTAGILLQLLLSADSVAQFLHGKSVGSVALYLS